MFFVTISPSMLPISQLTPSPVGSVHQPRNLPVYSFSMISGTRSLPMGRPLYTSMLGMVWPFRGSNFTVQTVLKGQSSAIWKTGSSVYTWKRRTSQSRGSKSPFQNVCLAPPNILPSSFSPIQTPPAKLALAKPRNSNNTQGYVCCVLYDISISMPISTITSRSSTIHKT